MKQQMIMSAVTCTIQVLPLMIFIAVGNIAAMVLFSLYLFFLLWFYRRTKPGRRLIKNLWRFSLQVEKDLLGSNADAD